MITFDGIKENLSFIIIETTKQMQSTLDFLQSSGRDGYNEILNRDGYLDNLKNIIESQCYLRINNARDTTRFEINEVRSIQTIGVNLERMGDGCVNILRQTEHLKNPDFLNKFECQGIFSKLLWGLGEVNEALRSKDLSMALEICKIEIDIDVLYKENFDKIMRRLKTGRNVEDLVTTLFIFRYLERMGDSLLNVGEAIIFAITGEKIKIEQFLLLKKNLAQSEYKVGLDNLDLTGIWGTHSGCRIRRVQAQETAEGKAPMGVIFKEGEYRKIRRECDSISDWEELYPGIVPRVISFHGEHDTASIMMEYLPGKSLDEIVLNSGAAVIDGVIDEVTDLIGTIWSQTRRYDKTPCAPDYMSQLMRRMDEVLAVHKKFMKYEQMLGSVESRASESLIQECAKIESSLSLPFSVRIHGDFNVNNMLYDFDNQKLHFIDVYRSRHADYIQDVSVFLVSNFRIPIFQKDMRKNINRVIKRFYTFSETFASEYDDPLFGVRLALALCRSFYTSTRFELNMKFANEMFMRSHYIMEKLIRHRRSGASWEEFKLPTQVLYY